MVVSTSSAIREAIPIILVIAVAAGLTIAVLTAPTNPPSPYQYQRSVTVLVQGKNIYINITTYAPTYYYYYYYYYYGGNYTGGVPIKVMVVLEKFVNNTPVISRFTSVTTSPGKLVQVVFQNVSSGTYRVKVMFWNDFLVKLYNSNNAWVPLARPEFKNVTVT